MSLQDILDEPEDNSQRCVCCIWYEELSPEDRRAADNHLISGGSIAKLWRASTSMGLTVGYSWFKQHLDCHGLKYSAVKRGSL